MGYGLLGDNLCVQTCKGIICVLRLARGQFVCSDLLGDNLCVQVCQGITVQAGKRAICVFRIARGQFV